MRQTWPSIFAPPVFDNEESTRKAHILHLILWMSFGAFFIATLLVFFVFPLPIQFLSLLVIGGGLTLGMLYVLQRGAFRLASIGFLGGIWLIVFLMTVYSGGTRSFSAYLITLVILGTGLLLGSRASFMVAGGNTLAMIGLALYENRFGLPPPLLTITPVSASLELTFNYWWGAIIS